MPEQKLRETLAELERELAQVESLDDETRQRLGDVLGEIAETLREKRVEEIETGGLVDRVEDAGRDIYQSHPTLGALVSRLVDILGQMGI